MFRISNTVAGVATLALAALPMFAMATSAYAAQPVTVQVADLDLASTDGARELDRRVNAAAGAFCSDFTRIAENMTCKNAVHDEVEGKLEAMRISARTYAAR